MNREEAILEIREKYRQAGPLLNELQRRRWAANEALKIGHGGITAVSKALRISPNTIRAGIREITAGADESPPPSQLRIRKPGGGRKAKNTSLEQSESGQGQTESKPGPS